MAELKLDDEQLNAAVNTAILNALGETGREKMIQEAIKYLTTPSGTQYDGRPNPSPLYEILRSTARNIADAVFRERFEQNEEFKTKVHQLYVDAIEKMFYTDREKLVDKLASKIASALTEERY